MNHPMQFEALNRHIWCITCNKHTKLALFMSFQIELAKQQFRSLVSLQVSIVNIVVICTSFDRFLSHPFHARSASVRQQLFERKFVIVRSFQKL